MRCGYPSVIDVRAGLDELHDGLQANWIAWAFRAGRLQRG